MKKYKVLESIISTLIATLIFGVLMFIFDNEVLDWKFFLQLLIFAITMFLSNLFIIQKYKK